MHMSSLKALRSPATKNCLLLPWRAVKEALTLVWGREVEKDEDCNQKWDAVASRRKHSGGLSGAQDPFGDEVPRVVLGSHFGWSGKLALQHDV